MSKISFSGASTGTATFDIVAPATNTNRTITLPDSSGQVSVLDLRAAQTATGTAVDFLNIPATARRITVMFNGVSTNGGSSLRCQIGAGSVDAAATYNGGALVVIGTTSTAVTYANAVGFELEAATASRTAASVRYGHVVLTRITGDVWVLSSQMGETGTAIFDAFSGTKTLSGTLDRVRITPVNGTDQFDAGQISIMVE